MANKIKDIDMRDELYVGEIICKRLAFKSVAGHFINKQDYKPNMFRG